MKLLRFFLFLLIFVPGITDIKAADLFVSLKGSDRNAGTKEQPFASLGPAIRKARELRRLNDPSIKGGINIYVEAGVYKLEEPIVLRPEDSGTAESPTQIINISGQQAILSGGVRIGNWQKVKGSIKGLPKSAVGKVWVSDVPTAAGSVLEFRQLWVNGKKATRARDWNEGKMDRILSWDAVAQTCRIPLPKDKDLKNVEGMEMLIHQMWAIANLRIKAVEVKGQEAELHFMQPESRIQSEHPWPAPFISKKAGNSAFYLSNAIQFLDQPGEWYEDLKSRKIYYWPRKEEVLAAANVVVPVLETLVKIEGTIDHPVSYVFFKGISFQHSSWLRPARQGHVPHQAGMYMLDAYKLKIPGTPDKKTLENQAWVGRPAAAVEVSYAQHTGFEACRFEHHASTGLDYKIGTQHNEIKGNLFKDIGGTGILVGTFSDEATEVHLPYHPSDSREICTNESIVGNLVTDVTNEDWGAVGIGAGYVKGIKILHNEVTEVSYSGISMGWGWTKTNNAMSNNTINGNKIHHYGKHMYDVAGIYTLSAQPGSVISNNVVDSIYKAPYPHDPVHWFYLYTDEGSSYFTVKNNWTPEEKNLQNANGPGNVWLNNGPMVADSIKNAAGLPSVYAGLSKYRSNKNDGQSINHLVVEKPKVFELVLKNKKATDRASLEKICLANGIPASAIYQWENHWLIFNEVKDPKLLQQQLAAAFNEAVLKVYDKPFYEFNRQKNCRLEPAKEWDHVILSANLVKDEKMQKEYLDYHATQFEKWPELSQGFCNASFQRLLIFKNGRQLVLVISIPKGANLDELNPRTTLNNPRVDEWNALMKKYQEGIEGTKAGEVWVFFNKN
ncbi:right-handed parallel beta-helix repeat-containing protein [Pedobacter sp. MC2016-14]|uniref:L-rhamnose mutarotase n=1 Tax=Pedobacter sp. MC2016-14 TaxID=2897327 RepID=UPI001E4F5F3D|nr:L-rhamnose mutarotase [Pedobacter sp. MC2016-14]MCD0489357.1 right-handed parallel beta-helix repeat-containing protein [Pedobacter sp. MC2016-14]